MPIRVTTAAAAIAAAALALVLPAAASADLTFSTQWGSGGGNAPGQFQVPQGVAVDGAGNVYVADQNNDRIQKFTFDGVFEAAFGGPGNLNGPSHMGIDPQGNPLVADEGSYRGIKYSPAGAVLVQYGRFGTTPGGFRGNPRGIASDGAGNVYMIDSGGAGFVNVYAPDGTFLRTWGAAQGSAPGQWNLPRGIEVGPDGNVYVGDQNNHRVDVFTPTGAFVRTIGSATPGPAFLNAPNEVAFDKAGHMFVADPNGAGPNGSGLVEFDAQGNFVSRTVTATGATDTIHVFSVATGPNNSVFTTDVGKGRVVRFTEGAPPPQLGKTATAQAVIGTVQIQAPGSSQFLPLTKNTSVPMGSTLDTTHGSVSLALAKSSTGGTQTGTFSKGQFKITQSAAKSQKGLTQMTLMGGGITGCAKGKARAAKSSPHRQLSVSAHGRFRTRGRYSTATVRGTQWLTKDSCSGTLTIVRSGSVIVRDLVKRKNITLKKGQRYLARKR